ncbi:tetratricopeptide repeat protein [Mucilaginibacter ximonensis]|uniref:Tetratricopeptide repeat protein n=1 Tax=Mucilaginibacter ximonensis TaxID=538021 RepID=A0ABW5YBT9_9SPHI
MKRLLVLFWLSLPLCLMAQSDSTDNKAHETASSQADEYTYLIRANDNIEKGDLKSAGINIEKAFAINPNSADAHNTRGLLETHLHLYKGALADFSEAIKLQGPKGGPNLWKAYNNRGYCQSQLHDYAGAYADYEKALSFNPNSAMANLNMGNLNIDLKHYNKAILYYTNALVADEKFGKAYNNRGLAKYLTGDKKGGCADLNKALQLGYAEAKQNLINYCK